MIDNITLWHRRARPEPTEKDFNTQFGCHIEEFVEMLRAVGWTIHDVDLWDEFDYLFSQLEDFANAVKCHSIMISIEDRKELLDALADQIVTAVGVGVCANMDMDAAVEEVNRSNWSKFNYRGFPEFDENGKIKKGDRYRKPDLKGMF